MEARLAKGWAVKFELVLGFHFSAAAASGKVYPSGGLFWSSLHLPVRSELSASWRALLSFFWWLLVERDRSVRVILPKGKRDRSVPGDSRKRRRAWTVDGERRVVVFEACNSHGDIAP